VLFISLILAYNLRWRPERSMLDPAGSDMSYAMMDNPNRDDDELDEVPLTNKAAQ
jgi:hypothetical protein